jgi:hypothetical protein
MKSFLFPHKNKKAGLSLLLAMVGSTLAMGIVIAILTVVTRSVEQSQGLERSTQTFFAIESGLEAGFFHHNARGQGVRFLPLDDPSFPEKQSIVHENVNITTDWTIDGRTETSTLDGLVYENTPLQLRWYWDDAESVEAIADPQTHTPNFTLSFDPDGQIPSNFDFGGVEDDVLISWMLTRRGSTIGLGSLVPKADDPEDPCIPDTSFICRDQLSSMSLSSGDTREGSLLPRTASQTVDTINNFILDGENFQLVLTPTLEFRNSATGDKIPGIPFRLIENGVSTLPRPEYSVYTSLSAGNFSKEIDVLNIPEQTSIQAFNYVIFD